MGYRAIIARFFAQWGIAQRCVCVCVKLSIKWSGYRTTLGGVPTSLKRYRAIWGIAAIVSQLGGHFSPGKKYLAPAPHSPQTPSWPLAPPALTRPGDPLGFSIKSRVCPLPAPRTPPFPSPEQKKYKISETCSKAILGHYNLERGRPLRCCSRSARSKFTFPRVCSFDGAQTVKCKP